MKSFLFAFILIALLIAPPVLTAHAQRYALPSETEEEKLAARQALADKIYRQLPKEDQERLIDEADQVFEYCSNRQLFSMFHDCRCVAAEFLDERILNPDLDKRIISVGDQVADKCPNGPGTAGYAYKQCTDLYGYKMPVGLDEFCTCYANSFAKLYEKDPRAFMPNITRIGSASLLICDDTGIISPLSPER